MGVYFQKGKGWRYDFILKGQRYSKCWFKTKAEARQAEAKKREELKNPPPAVEIPTDMAFLDLVNLRLDYVKAYKSQKYYVDHIYTVKRFVKEWRNLSCREITMQMVQRYLIRRARVSAFTANKDLRYLRALFNFGIKQNLVKYNPTQGMEFMPVERKLKYVPPKEDVAKVLLAANPDAQDYLIAIMDTMGRMSEINRLTWEDVDLKTKSVVLYTRKKKGGHLTPRQVHMTTRLFGMLVKRYKNRDKTKPWVFWDRRWSRKVGKFVEGPYQHRKNLMAKLCQQAGVRHFGFHALRHLGASIMDRANVPIGSIQRILGHENRTTTEIYLHSIGEAEREAMAIYERAWQDDLQEKSHTQSHTQ
ncbi:MAG: tyrosine-type recombinase/integrase [Thermodesulfobacteriota bacterium]